jgi:competence protein ComEC
MPLLLAVAFAASLVAVALVIRHRRAWTTPALSFSLALFACMCWQPWQPDVRKGMLEVTAIDVSQGDSFLVVFPEGETMLVDSGGFPGMERMTRKPQLDVGEEVVSPYLWSRSIRHLDYAVLTHGHSDHMAGLPAVLDNFRPRYLWIGAEPDSTGWAIVRHHAVADGVNILSFTRSSQPVKIGRAEVRFLAPSADYVAGDKASNNDSLVMEIRYGRRSVLMTGDAERAVEQDLAASGELQPVTLLKVGHHGSKTSSSEEFLDKVQPQLAIISDGYKNQFHHPHPDVLARLAAHRAAVFRTDQRGLITFRTDGERVELETFR